MNWHKATMGVLAGLFFFMLAGAIGTHLLLHRAPLNGVGSASFLLVAGGLVFLAAPKAARVRMLVMGLLGYISEVIGVKYGWLYGRYVYTEVLAPNVLGVPLVMVCAWFILLSYVQQLLARLRLAGWWEVVLGGLVMTAIDLLLDPVAAHPFNFWQWQESGIYYGIPGRNFLGWLIVSMAIFSVDKLIFRATWQRSGWQQIVGLGIIVLYTSSAFSYGYSIAGLMGVFLISWHVTLRILGKASTPAALNILNATSAN